MSTHLRRNAVVLVTDAEQRAALAVVRSLGRAGYTVHATGLSSRTLAGASRWCAGSTVVPDPMREPRRFAEAHAALATRLGAQVLIPVGEASALALLDDPPPGVRVPMPEASVFRRVCDKAEVLRCAHDVGLRVPVQQVIAHRDDPVRDVVPMPAIVKPARSVSGPGGAQLKLPVRYVDDAGALQQVLRDTPEAAFPLLLQERARGAGLGVFHLMWEGREVASFAHRRLREKPPSGGVSTYRESIALPPDLHARSLALLASLGVTHGVAMVEFKAEPGATPVLMEINGRFWGSLQLAIDAGVDFPALLVRLALGETVAPVTSWKTGVRSRWFWGDVDHLIARVRHGVDVTGTKSRNAVWPALRDVLLSAGTWREGEILRGDDRGPFLVETRNWFARR